MFKKFFITGLLVWIPLAITIWVISLIVSTLGAFVPDFLSSQALFHVHIPGFGFALVIVVIFLTGMFTANFLGRSLFVQWERLLNQIPLVRSIYKSVKQVSDTVLAPNGRAFRQAVLIEYPRKGAWTIAFLTGEPGGEVADRLPGEHLSVYVPTTPNPTSGFFLILPRAEIIELNMTVDAALKYIVSMGVVAPPAAIDLDASAAESGTPPDTPAATSSGSAS